MYFGTITTIIGNGLFDYASNVLIAASPKNSIIFLSLFQSSEKIMGILVNLIGGVYADRINKKKILIITDLLAGVLCFIFSFTANANDAKFILYLIFLNILLALLRAFNAPSSRAIIKEVILEENINKFNSVLTSSVEIARITIPLVSFAIFSLIGMNGVLILNAVTFIVSALAELYLTQLKSFPIKKKKISMDLIEGLYYVCRNKELLLILVTSAATNFFLAGYNLYLPYMNQISANNGMYAILIASISIGTICAGLFNKIRAQKVMKIKELYKNLIMFSVSLLIFSIFVILVDNLAMYIITTLLAGFFMGLFNISFFSYIQIKIDGEFIGRVISIIFTFGVILSPIGTAVFAFLFNNNMVFSFFYISIGLIITSIILFSIHYMYLKKI